jgi:hypothetical protein
MATMQLTSGDRYASDFVPIDQRGDNYGNEGVQQFNGKYAELVRRGVVFLYSTAVAGIALIVAATTGGHPTVWNPLGSGKIFYPLILRTTWLSGTTTVGAVHLHITKNAGAQIGTAAVIPTFTAVAPEQAAAGGPNTASNMRWSPATNTFTVAPAFWVTTGLNMAGTAPINSQEVDFDGGLALYPGTAMSVTYSVATSTSLHHVTIWGAELPIV